MMVRKLLIAMLLAGCADSSSAAVPIDVTGTWKGSWTSTDFPAMGSIEFELDEDGEGRGLIQGSVCLSGIEVRATIGSSGRVVTIEMQSPVALPALLAELSVSRNSLQMSGTYRNINGGFLCVGDGTMILQKEVE